MAFNHGRDKLVNDKIVLLYEASQVWPNKSDFSGSWYEQINGQHMEFCHSPITSSGNSVYFEANPDPAFGDNHGRQGKIPYNASIMEFEPTASHSGSTAGKSWSGVIKYGDDPDGTNTGWFSKRSSNDLNNPWHLGRPSTGPKIRLIASDASIDSQNITIDEITAFTMVCDQTGRYEAWVNGELSAETNVSDRNWHTNTKAVYVGTAGAGGQPLGNYYADVHIYEIAMYNKPLSVAEIKHNYEYHRNKYNL